MLRQIQRRYITLIEMMIVMSLLVILMGVTSLSIYQAIIEERYRAGVSQVVSRLQMAQDIMLIIRSDVIVHLEQQPGGLLCRLEVSRPLAPLLQRIVDRTGIIAGISSFTWTAVDGQVVTNQNVALNFKANGVQLSRGELKISNANLNSFVLVSGFAEPIMVSAESRLAGLQRMVNSTPSLQTLYPTEVRMAIEPFLNFLLNRPTTSLGGS